MKYLCEIGMITKRTAQVLKQVALSTATKGRALADTKFANVVTMVLGQDAMPALGSAGILP